MEQEIIKFDLVARRTDFSARPRLYRVHIATEDSVSMYPAGGGFEIKCRPGQLRKATDAEIYPEPSSQQFTMEWMCDVDPDVSFAGIIKGDKWNGWSIPYFTRDEGFRMIAWLTLRSVDVGQDVDLRYDDLKDVFIWKNVSDGADDVSDTVGFKGVKYYRIFSDCCWEEIEEIEHAKN